MRELFGTINCEKSDNINKLITFSVLPLSRDNRFINKIFNLFDMQFKQIVIEQFQFNLI